MYDKTGREIRAGDTIKIFHFIGTRRKKHYMYKFVEDLKQYEHGEMFTIKHLNLDNEHYHLKNDNKIHPEIEIIQGYNNMDGELSYQDRPIKR